MPSCTMNFRAPGWARRTHDSQLRRCCPLPRCGRVHQRRGGYKKQHACWNSHVRCSRWTEQCCAFLLLTSLACRVIRVMCGPHSYLANCKAGFGPGRPAAPLSHSVPHPSSLADTRLLPAPRCGKWSIRRLRFPPVPSSLGTTSLLQSCTRTTRRMKRPALR